MNGVSSARQPSARHCTTLATLEQVSWAADRLTDTAPRSFKILGVALTSFAPDLLRASFDYATRTRNMRGTGTVVGTL